MAVLRETQITNSKKKRLARLAGESARFTSRIYTTAYVVMPVPSKAL